MKKTKYNSALPLMLFFFLGIMMSIPCEAQNTIYKHPACNSETSLIRYYKKNVDIRVELWVIDPGAIIHRAAVTSTVPRGMHIHSISPAIVL